MKKQKWLIIATVGGMLATSAVAGAGGLVEKVNGFLRSDVKVTVNGNVTSLHPVYIDGKAYLPAREAADALGYSLNWSKDEIELQKQDVEEEADFLQLTGVIVDVTPVDDQYRLEVLGHGLNNWMILYADRETVLTNAEGEAFAAEELKAGLQITAQYGPIIALSFPGQSHAATIEVGSERLIKEQAISAVELTEDGWQIQFSELKDGQETPTLTLNAGKETMLVTREGMPVEWSQLKPGTKVRAYYGPMMTKSLPPQSPAHIIVVLDEQLNIDPATVKEYRELAWPFVPEEQKQHLITKQDEAQVSMVQAKGAAIIALDEQQEKVLAEVVANDGQLICVTYNTDQDALIGPLMVVIHPETKELVGYFLRM